MRRPGGHRGPTRWRGIFTDDASYRQSPYEQPVIGLDAIRRMWQEERPYWPEHPHAADNDPS
jgi:hypothetical protein